MYNLPKSVQEWVGLESPHIKSSWIWGNLFAISLWRVRFHWGWCDILRQQNFKDEEELLAEDSDEDTFTTLSEISVQKRIKQNLANINFDEDSDDDNEYSPTIEEEEEFEALNIATKQQRKRKNETDLPQPKKKTKPLPKADTSLSCELCQITYSRKDNLKRHVLKKH